MNTSEIESLLSKFYEGKTDLQEEQILRDYFQGKTVPAHLKSHQPIFAYYSSEKQQKLNDKNFEQKLTSQLREDIAEIPIVTMHPTRNRILYVTGIAASILMLIGLFFTFQQDVFKSFSGKADKVNTEIAYADASQALLMVSGNLNNGLKQVERLQMVDKAMKNMQLFNKFYQCETIIINPDLISNQSIKSK